jgi:hypothetical protein
MVGVEGAAALLLKRGKRQVEGFEKGGAGGAGDDDEVLGIGKAESSVGTEGGVQSSGEEGVGKLAVVCMGF